MSHIIIDRRLNAKGRSVVNRQRFVQRAKQQIKRAVKEHIKEGNIEDLASGRGKKVQIPVKDLNEPIFNHGDGGRVDVIHPGNKEYVAGDRFKRPQKGEGEGKSHKGSDDPTVGTDIFEFHLTEEEFLDLFFEDLELPDLLKKQITTIDHYETRRAGYTVDGNPSQLNIMKSMKTAKGRRIALHGTKKKKLAMLIQERDDLLKTIELAVDEERNKIQTRLNEIQHEIKIILKRIKKIPFVDDIDLRYNRYEQQPIPATRAVVFNIMDVSASMGEWEKEMAKSFYLLMLLFLQHNYKHVDIVYIRYHTNATEVNEDEFFHGRETGGTTVSPALELTYNLIVQRYPLDQWNIYGCHISDGDNFPNDTPIAIDIMQHKILPKMQYFAYVEIDQHDKKDSDLWKTYEDELSIYERFSMNTITGPTQIYPVFRRLFEAKLTDTLT